LLARGRLRLGFAPQAHRTEGQVPTVERHDEDRAAQEEQPEVETEQDQGAVPSDHRNPISHEAPEQAEQQEKTLDGYSGVIDAQGAQWHSGLRHTASAELWNVTPNTSGRWDALSALPAPTTVSRSDGR
jgi:hypothetical protein